MGIFMSKVHRSVLTRCTVRGRSGECANEVGVYGRLLHPSPRDHGFDATPRAPGTAQGPEARGMYLVPEGGHQTHEPEG